MIMGNGACDGDFDKNTNKNMRIMTMVEKQQVVVAKVSKTLQF